MYVLTLAIRYLLKRRIAYISIVAIAFGLMAMIVVSSVMDGFQLKIRSSIYKVDGSLSIWVDNDEIRHAPEHYEVVRRQLEPFLAENGGPIVATSKRVSQFAMINSTAGALPGLPPRIERETARLFGIDPLLERDVLPLEQMMRDVRDEENGVNLNEGLMVLEVDDPRAAHFFDYCPRSGPRPIEHSIILGLELARSLGVRRGDRVTVVSAIVSNEEIDRFEPVSQAFIVAGAFRSGRYEYDREIAFCEGEALRSMLQLTNDCTWVIARLEDPERAREVADAVLRSTRGTIAPLKAHTWEDRMGSYAAALQFEKVAMLVVLACIIIVAGASICGILYMVVLEKTRDIGILLSMGATSRGVVGVFLVYGGALGLIGAGLGVLLGIEATLHLDAILRFIERTLDIELFPKNVYEFAELPTHLDYGTVAVYSILTFAWCVVSSVLPALRAARLDPIKCLAYE
ncbi:MAG: FtsX-like permease family protein [Planctomycetota bacterium]